MALFEDFSKYSEPDPNFKEQPESLLRKYDIPIHHFEFSYVEKCTNGKELEKILLVLRSGQEGHYPDLIQSTEERLKIIKPKSKLLRTTTRILNKNELDKAEQEEIVTDLNNWVQKISKNDRELEGRKTVGVQHPSEVRQAKEAPQTDAEIKEKRIGSTDYKAWDKYDPDTEILKQDLKEQQEKEKAKVVQEKPKKSVHFNACATEAEAQFHSERERETGNEFFRNKEYEEALICYTNSVRYKMSVTNLNNRAATYFKLKKYQDALGDCEKVLVLDKNNVKANLKKSKALEQLERFEEALKAVEDVIRVNPNNDCAQNLAERIRKRFGSEKKVTRMKIVEIE